MGVGHGFLHGLSLSGLFFYKALWSILFGVAVTAAVDVFVDKDRLARLLGRRTVRATTLGAAGGAASSACTFGAVTVAQSLFKKGASAEATFGFALAATNIVFELGILIYLLLGGAYLGAELIAGVLLVVIVHLLVRATLPVGVFERSRARLVARDGDTPGAAPAGVTPLAAGRGSVPAQLRSFDGWYRIAGRYLKTISRIYKSVLGGFFVAGFIVLIPASALTTVFLPARSPLAVVEDAALGVLVGVFSFIGSIGIVPFAAALWFGGVGFAGVLGVIVADTITVPVLALWRSFFGTRATAYIFGVFYSAMSTSAVAIYYLFDAAGSLPHRPSGARLRQEVALHLDYTFYLTLAFLALTVGLWVVKRVGDRRAAAAAAVAAAAARPTYR